MGAMYETERGVAQDYTEAVRWYREAAEQGLVLSQHNLGFMYANGRGVSRDYIEALKWANIAASQSSESAISEETEMLRRDLMERMTRKQITEARRRSLEWRLQRRNQ